MNNLSDIQVDIIKFIMLWAKTQKTPIPVKKIVNYMADNNISESRATHAIRTLNKRKFIRKSVDRRTKNCYILLRGL